MKGAREGVRVLVQFSSEHRALLDRFVQEFGPSEFSPLCRKDLARVPLPLEAVRLLEAECALGMFGDGREHKDLRAATLRVLKRRGVSLTRGKKPSPAMVAMVGGLAPILLAYGIPLASGDNARMVTVLRRIAAELAMCGDPRDELRRLVRAERARAAHVERFVSNAIRAALTDIAP